jgi:hypothetical protein
MTQTLGATIRRFLDPPAEDRVHFHLGHDGRPYVCDFAHCDSPGLSVDEVSRRASVGRVGRGQN